MKFKKFLAILFVIALGTLSFSACGKDSDKDTDKDADKGTNNGTEQTGDSDTADSGELKFPELPNITGRHCCSTEMAGNDGGISWR
jgi:hypothetical protein